MENGIGAALGIIPFLFFLVYIGGIVFVIWAIVTMLNRMKEKNEILREIVQKLDNLTKKE
jgi:threonine/homoserine/homoserine lactone efflux protein